MHIPTGTQSVITLSTVPKSRNVSAGTVVEFTCATEESGVILAVTATPTVAGSVANLTDLPNGGNQFTLSFTAPSEHSSITIACVAIRSPDVFQVTALLMIQGNMADIEYICTTTYCVCMLCLKGYHKESAGQILCANNYL